MFFSIDMTHASSTSNISRTSYPRLYRSQQKERAHYFSNVWANNQFQAGKLDEPKVNGRDLRV